MADEGYLDGLTPEQREAFDGLVRRYPVEHFRQAAARLLDQARADARRRREAQAPPRGPDRRVSTAPYYGPERRAGGDRRS